MIIQKPRKFAEPDREFEKKLLEKVRNITYQKLQWLRAILSHNASF